MTTSGQRSSDSSLLIFHSSALARKTEQHGGPQKSQTRNSFSSAQYKRTPGSCISNVSCLSSMPAQSLAHKPGCQVVPTLTSRLVPAAHRREATEPRQALLWMKEEAAGKFGRVHVCFVLLITYHLCSCWGQCKQECHHADSYCRGRKRLSCKLTQLM